MSQGFDVDLGVLDHAAEAVAQTMHDMKTCQVEDICGDEQQYGHATLHEAFAYFCQRWQYGVDVLIEDGDTITRTLNKVVDTYIATDEEAARTMHVSGSGVDPATDVADG